ncbi:MAG: GNAT family N-acetyltransferase [Sphaerochaetaceae bacterium]
MGLQIATLADTPIEVIHRVFKEAFADYEIEVSLSLEAFREMMVVRDLDSTYSVGCFDAGQLVGFIICGHRLIHGQTCLYDGGTGVIQRYRHQGLGTLMLKYLIEIVRHQEKGCFVLEVLEHNTAAIELYLKHGFRIRRRFDCLAIQKEAVRTCEAGPYSIDTDITGYQTIDPSHFLDCPPSWQNDQVSVMNALDTFGYVCIRHQGLAIGYGLIQKRKGDIPQLGVLPTWRGRHIEELILNKLMDQTSSGRITLLNVDQDDGLGTVLRSIGFQVFICQYEMEWTENG